MKPDAPYEGADEYFQEYIRLGVCCHPKPHDDEGKPAEDRWREIDCDGGKERVEKAGNFSHRFHIAQFKGFNTDPIYDKVVEKRRLNTEEYACSKDSTC